MKRILALVFTLLASVAFGQNAARTYTNEWDDITGAVMGAGLSTTEFKDYHPDGYSVSNEAITVPASADSDGKYRVMLTMQPRQGSLTVTRTSGSVVLSQVASTTTPGANDVGVDWQKGVLIFPSTAASAAHTATYTGNGSVMLGARWNQMQKDVTVLNSGAVKGPSSATDNAIVRFDATTGKLVQNSSLLITDAGILTDSTGNAILRSFSSTSVALGKTRSTSDNQSLSVIIGYSAGPGASGVTGAGVAIGYGCGYNWTSTGSVGAVHIGESSGMTVTSGAGNVLIGSDCGRSDSSDYVGKGITTGANNVAIGQNAGATDQSSPKDQTGSNNIAIGTNTDWMADPATNRVVIGNGAKSTADSQFMMGTSSYEVMIPGTLKFEGSSDDANETSFAITDPTADRTITIPDATGTVPLLQSANVFTTGQSIDTGTPLTFEGATADAYETSIAVTDPTADRTITLPNSTGTVALTSDIPAAANPSASVGLSAVNGAATTFMRSDGAPALDQAIIPTWTGAHTFSAAVTANGDVTIGNASTDNLIVADDDPELTNIATGTDTHFLTLDSGNLVRKEAVGLSQTIDIYDSGASGTHSLTFTNGLLTGYVFNP